MTFSLVSEPVEPRSTRRLCTYHDPDYIYALVDPRDGEVRYVGRTQDPPHRLYQHRTSRTGTTPLAGWLHELGPNRREVVMVLLEIITPESRDPDGVLGAEDLTRRREVEWIKRMAESGAPITNRQHAP